MKAINLFTFTRIQQDYATEYENLLSRRVKKEKVKVHEFETLVNLVELLLTKGVAISVLEGFFYSFKIEQISKEFDLLKIDQTNLVLNIELKSEPIEEKKIKKQLEQNKYYLKHLADDIRLFTFIGETKEIYQYIDGDVVKVQIDVLVDAMKLFTSGILEGIEALFDANKFLISPLNTPEEFLKGQYFLTSQQEEIKKAILDIVNERVGMPCLFGITGKAGTGKTLLLYDLVRTILGRGNRCCVIHSGILCDGHHYLNENWNDVDIIAAKELNGEGYKLLEKYDFIFVDESQRIYQSAVDEIVNEVSKKGKTAIFSYDFVQSLSYTEERRNIPDVLNRINGFQEYSLSEKIRTSKELASFYKTLLNLNHASKGYMDYSNIEVLYANNINEALRLIDLYENQYGYVFISYTQSVYKVDMIDKYPNKHDTHHVIGQEFDKIMLVVDHNFRYGEDGRIQEREHPNPDYHFYKLLYQGVSRAREKLCILVVENYTMFQQISNIKYHMLERYLYKESTVNSAVSGKKLNKMMKSIKDSLIEVDSEDAETIKDAVVMINDELLADDPKKKVICNGIKLLTMILVGNGESVSVCAAVQDYIDYVCKVSLDIWEEKKDGVHNKI